MKQSYFLLFIVLFNLNLSAMKQETPASIEQQKQALEVNKDKYKNIYNQNRQFQAVRAR